MKVSEILQKGWTQGAYARDEDDYVTDPVYENAIKWCLSGAIAKAGLDIEASYEWIKHIRTVTGVSPVSYNDELGRTQAEVVALAQQIETLLGVEG